MSATNATHELDGRGLRDAFARYPSGVVAVAAEVDGEPVAMVASSFTVGVSQDPPMVLFSAQHSSSTWPLLRDRERLGISVLALDHSELVRQLTSAIREERFSGIDYHRTSEGAILLPGSALHLDCSIVNVVPAGDHDVVIFEVHRLGYDAEIEPVVFHGSAFRALA